MQFGVFVMAFGMEHYFHHKYHAHAEAAAPAAAPVETPKADKSAVNAGLPAAAAVAAAASEEPLPSNMDDLAKEIKMLREEIASLRQGMRVTADAAASATPAKKK